MNTRPAAPAPRLIDMGMRKLYALDPRAAFAAGAPEVFDEVTVDGRFGIVLRRLDGPTLQQLLLTSAMTPEQVGAILASLYTSVHKTPPPDVPLAPPLDRFRIAGLPRHTAAAHRHRRRSGRHRHHFNTRELRNVSTTLIHPGSAFRLGSSALTLVD
jgi:hypothetical protein